MSLPSTGSGDGLIRPDILLGPILVGIVVNSMLYGGCVVQCSSYWMSSRAKEDNWVLKTLVAWVILLDTFHSISLVYTLWAYSITNFSNPQFLTTAVWPFSATPMITILTSCPTQVYLSWRIKCFSKSIRVFAFLLLLAFAQAVLGITCSIKAFMIPNIVNFHRLIPFVDAWQAATVACDVSITALLWWYLSKSTGNTNRSDNVITSVVFMSIETATFGAFFCIMDLVTFTTLLSTNLHVIFAFPLGRIYTNTLLMTLNSRNSLQERFRSSSFLSDIHIETTPGPHPSARFTQTMQICSNFDIWNPSQVTSERVLITDLPKDIESAPNSA